MSGPRSLLSLVALALAACAEEEPTQVLRFHYQKGQKAQFEAEGHTRMWSGESDEPQVETRVQFEFESEVVATVGDGARVQTTFRRLRFVAPGMEYDSDSEEPLEPPFEGFSSIVGATATAVVDHRGAVSEAALPSALSDPLEDLPIDLQQLSQPNVAFLPEAAVRPGDRWPIVVEMPMGQLGEMSVSFDCELMEIDGPLVVIEFTGSMDLTGLPSQMPRLDSAIEGDVTLDLDSGFTERMAMTVSMESGEGGTRMVQSTSFRRTDR